jgi:hypothetical protein
MIIVKLTAGVIYMTDCVLMLVPNVVNLPYPQRGVEVDAVLLIE